MAKPFVNLVAMLTPKRRWAQFSLGTMLIVVIAVCVSLSVWVHRAQRQQDVESLTVVIRAGKNTRYADVVNVFEALADSKVAKIETEFGGRQTTGVSAVIRARSDTPY